MRYGSTNGGSERVGFEDAVMNGMPRDGGLFIPEAMPRLDPAVVARLGSLDFHELAFEMVSPFVGDSIPSDTVRSMVADAFNFAVPLVDLGDGRYSLELFHGPTCAFKDFGARFMARILAYFARRRGQAVTIVTATSGDTGSAVAQAFHGVAGVRVFVLYPRGRVSPVQEAQMATLGGNITALAVDGSFDDCQRLVKSTFADPDIRTRLALSSANSINIARLVPQTAYYAEIARQLIADGVVSFDAAAGRTDPGIVVAVPSGNFGDLTAGLYARAMGIPLARFVAATNVNDTVPRYLETGVYRPKDSVRTIANAMDVGAPSNFARIASLFGNDVDAVRVVVTGVSFSDDELRGAIAAADRRCGYVLDPHGAAGWLGLEKLAAGVSSGAGRDRHSGAARPVGVFLETAHPAKFRETVEPVLGRPVALPASLGVALGRPLTSRQFPDDLGALKDLLLA